MKYFVVIVLFLTTVPMAHSQTYEIGGLLGGTNYIGEVGPTNYINPNDLAVGLLFRWNRSPRHAFRASALLAGINADDANSKEPRREQRGYAFENNIKEFSLGIEYSFWEYNVHKGQGENSPYLYTGITYLNYDSLFLDTDSQIKKYGTDWAFAIPMVVGYKAMLTHNISIGFEIGARYTLTDNLDGSNPTGEKENDVNLKFGNINSNDWYVFTGIHLTFGFGRLPCYCSF